jgi:hypothetical protein
MPGISYTQSNKDAWAGERFKCLNSFSASFNRYLDKVLVLKNKQLSRKFSSISMASLKKHTLVYAIIMFDPGCQPKFEQISNSKYETSG